MAEPPAAGAPGRAGGSGASTAAGGGLLGRRDGRPRRGAPLPARSRDEAPAGEVAVLPPPRNAAAAARSLPPAARPPEPAPPLRAAGRGRAASVAGGVAGPPPNDAGAAARAGAPALAGAAPAAAPAGRRLERPDVPSPGRDAADAAAAAPAAGAAAVPIALLLRHGRAVPSRFRNASARPRRPLRTPGRGKVARQRSAAASGPLAPRRRALLLLGPAPAPGGLQWYPPARSRHRAVAAC
jgi:hypothetical protein